MYTKIIASSCQMARRNAGTDYLDQIRQAASAGAVDTAPPFELYFYVFQTSSAPSAVFGSKKSVLTR
jgi:hypothetical protein